MIIFIILVFLFFSSSLGDGSVSFPDDNPVNGTIQNRFGWALFGNYIKALNTILGGRSEAPIQTQTVATSTIPPMTTNRPSIPTAFPPLPPGASPFPEFVSPTTSDTVIMTTSSTDSFSIGIGSESFPSISGAEVDAVGVERCQCLPLELCVNHTTRGEATTRIVTRPPVGTTCPPGQVYCCADSVKLGCGVPNIIPGVHPGEGQANLGEFPWTAIILTNEDVYVGGGVLVDANHILTAAHRVARYGNGAGLKVRLGDWDLSREDEPVRFLEVRISRIVNHPRFEANTLRNDISIITLANSVPTLTRPYPQINTICLPESTDIFTGSRCRVAGWGKDQFHGEYQSIMKEVEVPVLSSIDCQRKLRLTRLGSSFVLDTNSFICAGGEAGRDACTGDGGNALACLRNGQYYIAGITAGGIECGNENVPGLYVNVVNYLTWIYSTINANSGGIDPRRRPV